MKGKTRCMYMFKYRCVRDSVIKKGQQQHHHHQQQQSFVCLNSDQCKDVVTKKNCGYNG